ncbi:uroporphyrinogen-III synthase [Erythrobacter gaetbuli]|uniref:Uroporphyrinogen-III synthase n=1 Tax=Qipengyuania gaetbuli TaxID=266952 RepID=A0A844XX97_9SPHN|nr:uroporphyrinogen-III synthase [Qipengyuania gaetbuli]MXO49969.1 uroporphyrinogen-III synthase [Qipengyuania gaetbuli]
MSRPVFVFRPEPGLSVTLETARALGLDARGCPLFEVEPAEWGAPTADDYDGLLVGSSNVFRHGGINLDRLVKLPVYAVGEATAEGAREKGFIVSRTGRGGLQALLDEAKLDGRRLLRLAGEAHVELDPPEGTHIDTRVVYRTVRLDIPEDMAAALGKGGIVLLHSGEAAVRLREECERLGIDRSAITVAALGPRIAGMAGDGWQSVHTSSHPRDAELLALVEQLCQTGAG